MFGLVLFGIFFGSAGAAELMVSNTLRGSDDRGNFKVQYLQVSPKSLPGPVRAKINARLEKQARAWLCPRNKKRRKQLGVEVQTDIVYQTEEVLVLEQEYDTNCEFSLETGVVAVIIDLKSGEQVDVEKQVKDMKTFRPFLVQKIRSNLPEAPGDCAEYYTEEELGSRTFAYSMADANLLVEPEYSGKIQSCGFATEIPLEQLAPFAKAGSLLFRLSQKE